MLTHMYTYMQRSKLNVERLSHSLPHIFNIFVLVNPRKCIHGIW